MLIRSYLQVEGAFGHVILGNWKTYKKAYVMYWECRGLALEGLPHSDPRLGNGCKNHEKGASYEIL